MGLIEPHAYRRITLYVPHLQVRSLQLVRVLQGGHRAAPVTALAW